MAFSDGKISVVPKDIKKPNKIIWGLQRSLINNAVTGGRRKGATQNQRSRFLQIKKENSYN